MKFFKRYIMLVLLVTLATGCGESFKAHQTIDNEVAETGSTSNLFGPDGFRNTETSQDQDLVIANRYRDILLGRETATQNLTSSIQAFDLEIEVSSSSMKITSKVTYSCNESREYSRVVTLAELQSGDSLSLGTQANTEVQVQCKDSQCKEMVAAIIRRDNFFNAAVLVGLSANTTRENKVFYLSRGVNYTPYFSTFHTGDFYRQRQGCSEPEEEKSVKDQIIGIIQEEAKDRLIKEAKDFLEDIF